MKWACAAGRVSRPMSQRKFDAAFSLGRSDVNHHRIIGGKSFWKTKSCVILFLIGRAVAGASESDMDETGHSGEAQNRRLPAILARAIFFCLQTTVTH